MSILVIGIFIFSLIILITLSIQTKKNKHKKQQVTALKVYEKIKKIPFDGQKINYLRKIDAFVFEEFLLDCFERKGYKVIRNKRYTGDGGIDGKVIIDNVVHLVQAKRYSSHISKKHIHDFIGLVERRKVKGFFIHTGRTGKGSKDVIYNNPNVVMISGNSLLELINN